MRKGLLKFGSRTSLVGLEAIAAFFGLILLIVGLLLWRVASGPVDVGFARKYVEQALHDPATDTDVLLGDVSLRWPKFSGPLELKLTHVAIKRGGRRVLSVENAGIELSTTHLLVGRVSPVAIMLDHPVVSVLRTADNHFSISAESSEAPEKPVTGEQPNLLLEMINSLTSPRQEAAKKHPPYAGLKTIRITDATMIVEDHSAAVTWYLQHMNFEFGRDRKGLAVNATLPLPASTQGPSLLAFDAVFGREDRTLHFNLHLQNVNPAIAGGQSKKLAFLSGQTMAVTGNLSGWLDKDMTVQSLSLDLSSPSGVVAMPGIYNQPLPYQALQIKAVYDGKASSVAVQKLQATIKGVPIQGAADMKFGANDAKATVKFAIPQITQSQIGPLWPDSLQGDGAQVWLVHKLSKGIARNLSVQVDINTRRPQATFEQPYPEWKTDVDNITGSFDVAGMTVDYRNPLTPITDASGHGVFRNGNLEIDIKSGTLGDMAVSNSHVLLDNIVHAHEGMATIDVNVKGPLKTVFRYIEDEPIGMTREALGFDSSGVKGEAALAISVSFPTVKNLLAEQVKVKVSGPMQNVTLPGVVEGMTLAGGPFQLNVADAAAKLAGKGTLDGQPIDLVWEKYLHPEGKPFSSRVKAALTSNDNLRKKLGIDLPDWISGAMPVDIAYTAMPDHRATVDVKADLTPGTVMVGPFNYTKAPGIAGELSCTVSLDSGVVKDVSALHVKTPDLALDNAHMIFGPRAGKNTLRSANMPSARLGETNMAVDLTIADDGKMQITGRGAFLDATPFLADKNPNSPPAARPALSADITVDKMRTRPEHTIEKVKLTLDRDAGGTLNRMALDATAGKGLVSMRLQPDSTGRMTFKAAADDAGAVFRAFDIYRNAVGGKLVIEGQSPDTSNKSVIVGTARILDFRVVNAPVLARLVNGISLAGLAQLLNSDGMVFSRLEGGFEWHLRSEGDLYVIKDGHTSGASLGLTFAGSVDKQKHLTDIGGTIVPVSGINGLVGNIPVLGQILTGGGALFAFTYTIQGPSDNPSVSVNPLSALAPGILRKIFFESDNK